MASSISASAMFEDAVAETTIEYKADDLKYDLGMLRADDGHPIDIEAITADKEGYLKQRTTENTQLLVRGIFSLLIEQTPLGPVAVLPPHTTRLPRSKPVPKPKPLTRWEKFAKSKGIDKKKKARMLYDEPSGEWAPRFGYQRKGDVSKDWAYELKPGDDPKVDHVERLELEKKQRVLKNKITQVSNMEHAEKVKAGKAGFKMDAATKKTLMAGPAKDAMQATASKKDIRLAAKLAAKDVNKRAHSSSGPELGDHVRAGAGEPKARFPVGIAPVPISEGKVDSAFAGKGYGPRLHAREEASTKASRIALAQVSTASLGRFDKELQGEPARPKDPRKLKRLPNEVGAKDEARRNADILRRVLGGSGEGEAADSAGVPIAAGSKRRADGEGGARPNKKRR